MVTIFAHTGHPTHPNPPHTFRKLSRPESIYTRPHVFQARGGGKHSTGVEETLLELSRRKRRCAARWAILSATALDAQRVLSLCSTCVCMYMVTSISTTYTLLSDTSREHGYPIEASEATHAGPTIDCSRLLKYSHPCTCHQRFAPASWMLPTRCAPSSTLCLLYASSVNLREGRHLGDHTPATQIKNRITAA